MPHSYGYRARTRSKFARSFRQHGMPGLKTYLQTYRLGDYVDIKANGAIQKGMPHSFYHGRTGRVWNVTKRAIGVEVNKKVGNKIIRKRIHVRIEHVSHSKCNQAHLEHIRMINKALRERAEKIKKGEKPEPLPSFKRLPALPKAGLLVKKGDNVIETLTPARFVNVF